MPLGLHAQESRQRNLLASVNLLEITNHDGERYIKAHAAA